MSGHLLGKHDCGYDRHPDWNTFWKKDMDYTFDVKHEDLKSAYRHRACRGAVFFPTLKKDWLHDVGDAYDKVRTMWRARLVELRAAGWSRLNGLKFQEARNCPPFGVRSQRNRFTCDRPRVCPFCWARAFVLKPHVHMEHLLYGGLKRGLSLLDKHAALVEFCFRRDPHATDGADWDSVLPDALAICRKLVQNRADRRFETDYFDHRGGFVLHSVEPGDGELHFRRSGLLVVDGRRVVSGPPHPEPGTYTEKVHRGVTKKALSEAVSRACAYPAGMLTRPVGEVVPVLNGLTRARMLTLFPRR